MNKTERNNHVSNINRLMRQEMKNFPGTLVLKQTATNKVQVAAQVLQKRYIFNTDIEAYFSDYICTDLQLFLKLFKDAEILRILVGDKVELETKTGTHYLPQQFLDFEAMVATHDTTKYNTAAILKSEHLNSLRPYLSTDDLRPAMTGVFVGNRRGSGYMCGTDAHILKHIRQPQLPDTFSEMIIPADVVSCIPKEGKIYLQKRADTSETYVLNCKTHRIAFEPIDAKYPDFLAVIPETFIPAAELDRAKVLQALKIAQNINTATKQFRLFSRGVSMYIRAEDLDTGQEYESMAVGTSLQDGYMQGFNAKLFETVLKDTDGDIVRLRSCEQNKLMANIGQDPVRVIMAVMLNSYA